MTAPSPQTASLDDRGHAATEPHPCPYQQEVNDDSTTLCVCCDMCRQECSDDV